MINESQLPLSSWNEQHQRTGETCFWTLTHQDTQSGILTTFFLKKKNVVVRPLTADGNLLQLTGSVNRNTLFTSHFLVFHRTHFNVARDIGSRCSAHRVIHVSCGCAS